MQSKMPLDNESQRRQPPGVIDTDSQLWLHFFAPLFEEQFFAVVGALHPPVGIEQLQAATLQAVVKVLADSGMTEDDIIDSLNAVTSENSAETAAWDDSMNDRRFALIDKELQGPLSLDEQRELKQLTQLMRKFIDTEAQYPVEGALKLHRILLDASDV